MTEEGTLLRALPEDNELLHPEIWIHAYPAIAAARTRAREYLASGGWCPREDVPEIRVNEHGWPWLSIDQFGNSNPRKISALFGRKAPATGHFSYEDVPEISAFFSYCQSRSDLIGSLLPPPDFPLNWLHEEFIKHLLFRVLDRCEAIGAETESAVRQVYQEAEKSIFLTSLPAELVVPIALGAFEFEGSMLIESDVWIESLDETMQRSRATNYRNSVSWGVLNAATHAIVVGDLTIDNGRPWGRLLNTRSQVDLAIDRVDQAIRALRVLTSEPIGYAQVLLRPLGWADRWTLDLPPILSLEQSRKYPDVLEEGYWNRSKSLISGAALAELPTVFRAIHCGNKRLHLASRRLDMAIMRNLADDKVIDCAIGLEALLGGDRTEITHKLALRAATLLREDFSVPLIYKGIRSVYNRRSEIVHGSDANKHRTMKIGDSEVDAAHGAVLLLQEVIKAFAREGGNMQPDHLDQRLLDTLDLDSAK